MGGSRRRSRARSRCGASLLLLSPVVVLVSRLLFGRRFVRNGSSPACIATGDARAMRVARVRRGWFSPPQSSRDVARVVLFSSLLSFRRSARGAPSIHPHASGGARITSGRAAHATRDATRAGCGKSERRAPSELAVCISRVGWLVLPLLSRCAVSRAPLPRSAARRGRAHYARARGARSARRDARGARGVRAPRALGARGPGSRERPSWASLGLPPAPRALLLRSLRSPRPPAGEARAERAGA